MKSEAFKSNRCVSYGRKIAGFLVLKINFNSFSFCGGKMECEFFMRHDG